jgi:ABC-type multidrug transport system ATPase subunit
MGKKPQGPMTVDVFGNKISVAELEERNEAEAARVAAKARREAKANAIGASASSDVRNSGNRDGDGYTTAMDGASALTGTGIGIASLEDQLRALVVKTTNGGKLTGKEKRIFAKAEKDGRLPGVHDDENDQNLNLNDDENNSSKKNKHPALSAPESWARSLEAVSVHARNGLGGDNEANASDAVVDVSGLDVSIRGVRLIENGSLTIGRGAKVALLGANGSGKSTLVRLLAVGKIKTNVHDVACVSQELEASEASAFESLRECDHVSAELFKEEQGLIKKMDDDTCGVLSQEQLQLTANRLGEIAEKLNNRNAYDSESNATRILTGLGFDERKMHAPLSTLSGGWRMRAALAVALFIKPGLLLLDEPTNHLDLPAVIWLGSYLNSEHMRNTSVLMVTHSADFVGQVATHLVHLDHHKKRLTQQKHCDVWRFLAAAPERFRLEKKEYDEQQKTLKQLKQQGSSGEAAVKKVLKGAGGGKGTELYVPNPASLFAHTRLTLIFYNKSEIQKRFRRRRLERFPRRFTRQTQRVRRFVHLPRIG